MTTSELPDPKREPQLERALAKLPHIIAPPSAVWTSVRASLDADALNEGAIQKGAVHERSSREPSAHQRRRRPRTLTPFALAAMLLVATSVALLRRSPTGSSEPMVSVAPVVDLATRATSDAAADMLAGLSAELEARRAVLSPETIAIVEQNMRAINVAIAETARALADDPGNVQLERMLAQVTRQREAFVRDTRSLVGDI